MRDWERGGFRNNTMRISQHTELEVYQKAFTAAMEIFRESQLFPKEERYSLTDQVRRSSKIRLCKHHRSLEKAEVSGSICCEAIRCRR